MRENQIVILQGPPCAGKTQWAKGQYMYFDKGPAIWEQKDLSWKSNDKGKYDIFTLSEITLAEHNFISFQIKNGYTVLVDSTNCNPERIKAFEELGKELDCQVIIEKFYISYDEAIARNKKRRNDRSKYIPREVITAFYKQYYPERFKDEMTDKRIIKTADPNLPGCVICDLDVTLALHTGRGPLDWDEIHTDKIDPRLRDILNSYMSRHIPIMFITGRIEAAREQTEEWLNNPDNGLLSKWRLYMRPGHCFDSGEEFKLKVYNEHIRDKYNVICVFEDSQKCVNMFREQGLLVCQTAITE